MIRKDEKGGINDGMPAMAAVAATAVSHQLSVISFQMRCNACCVLSTIRSGSCSSINYQLPTINLLCPAALQAFRFNSEALIETLK